MPRGVRALVIDRELLSDLIFAYADVYSSCNSTRSFYGLGREKQRGRPFLKSRIVYACARRSGDKLLTNKRPRGRRMVQRRIIHGDVRLMIVEMCVI